MLQDLGMLTLRQCIGPVREMTSPSLSDREICQKGVASRIEHRGPVSCGENKVDSENFTHRPHDRFRELTSHR